jgi:uncharacterized protein (UPF0332 family)
VKKGLLSRKYVGLLDHYRELRHQDQYSVEFFTTEEDCKRALETTKRFLSEMKKLVK